MTRPYQDGGHIPAFRNPSIFRLTKNIFLSYCSSKFMFKIKRIQVSTQWETKLKKAGLLDLEAVANRQFDWFEPPNHRRGGWSGVSRITLDPEMPTEDQTTVFLKIQQNHWFRAPHTFFRRQLTFVRELEAMMQITPIISFMPEILLFGQWTTGPDAGAVIITKALDGWIPLSDWLQGKNNLVPPDQDTLLRVLKAIASTSRKLNDAGWVHLSFYAKHVFVRPNKDAAYDVCLIDYEKCRRHVFPGYRYIKDCSQFMRRTPLMTDDNKRNYLKFYFQTDTFTPAHRRLIKKMPGAPQEL